MAEKKKYNSILISGRKDQTMTYSKYVKDEESGESVKESLDKKVNVTDELTTQQIKDGAITNEKMAADSVGNTNLQDGSVSNEKLEDGSITNEKLAENSITKDKLQDKTIGVEKLDNELRQAIAAATGLPEDLVETIQNVDDTLKDHQSQLDDKQSQIDDKQQQITANDEDISLLQTRSTQMEETIKGIAATGGASVANTVVYINTTSGLQSVNAQGAIDELAAKNKSQDATISAKANEFNIELEKTNSKEITLNKNEYISIGTYATVVGDTATMELVKKDGYSSTKFSVKKGDTIKLSGEGTTAPRLWFIVDKNNIITQCAENDAIATDNTVEVEHDGIFVFNTKNTIDSAFVRYISNYTKNINTVKTDIHNLRKELADYTGKDYDLVNGYSLFIGTYATVVGDTATMELVKKDGYSSTKFSVKKGDTIKLSGEGTTAPRLWFIVDKNNIITQCAENDAIATDNTVEVEHDGIFVFNTKNNINHYIRKITNTSKIKKDIEIFNKQKYELIENKATSVGIWSTKVGDKVIPTTVDKIGWATLIIDVTPNDTFVLTGVGDTSNKLYCFIDKNNTILAIADNGEARENYVIRVSDYVTQDCRMIYNTNRNGTINQYYVTQPISYLKKYSWIELKTEKTQSSMLVKWGDSLTNMGWGTAIEDYIANKHLDITIHNVGTGGEDIFQISARIGSMPTFLENGITLPVGRVKTQIGTKDSPNLYVVDENGNHHYIKLLLQGTEESINPLYINGIKCRLILEGDTYYLRSYYSLETEVMLQDNSNVFLAGSSKLYRPYIATLMIGANGGWDNDVDTLIKRTKKAIKNVGTPNYFIIGFFHNYTKEKALPFENRYIAEFGNRFINTRRFFVERAAAISGVTLSDNDKDNIANGTCPREAFMKDYIHFNELGRQLLGKFVLERLIEFGLM